jgi:hypothetical protein
MTRIVWLLAGLLLVLPGRATAQTSPTYVQFDPFTVKGALYRPADSPRDVALLLIHRVNNYLGHRAAVELSNRGFLVLTMNSRFDNNEASVIWEVIALDVKQGVEFTYSLSSSDGQHSSVLACGRPRRHRLLRRSRHERGAALDARQGRDPLRLHGEPGPAGRT